MLEDLNPSEYALLTDTDNCENILL